MESQLRARESCPLCESKAGEEYLEDTDDKNAATKIVTGSNQALGQRSASLVSRGLRHVSAWDLERVIEAGKELTSSLQMESVLRTMVAKVDEFLRPDNWSLLLVDEEKQELYFELTVGKDSQALRDVRIKLGHGISGYVAQTGVPAVVNDVRNDSGYSNKLELSREKEAQSIVAVPLRSNGKVLGVLELFDCVGPSGFLQGDLLALQGIADFAAIAIENARHCQSIHLLTITDEVTGLYNNRHFSFILDTEIDRCERYGYEFSLALINLGGLPRVSEYRGSFFPGELRVDEQRTLAALSEFGRLLMSTCRLVDFAFRCGEMTFAALLPTTSKERSCLFARNLHRSFRETMRRRYSESGLDLLASIGLTSYPDDARTKTELLQRAAEALCMVRNSGGDGVAASKIGTLSVL